MSRFVPSRKAKQKNATTSGIISGADKPKHHFGIKGKRVVLVMALVVALVAIGLYLVYQSEHKKTQNPSVSEPLNSVDRQITLGNERLSGAKTNEEKIDSLLFLAGDYRKKKDFDRAIQSYEQVLSLSPDNETAVTGLATTYYEIKDRDNSQRYLEKLIDLLNRPGNPNKDSLPIYEKMLANVKNNDFSPLPDNIGVES